MNGWSRFFIVCSVVGVAAQSACTPPPRPDELATADKLILNKIAMKQAAKAAPAAFKTAKRYYALAEKAYEDGDMDLCARHAILASIKLSTAVEHAKRLAAEDRKAKATARLKVATARKKELDGRLAQAKKRILRMEKILALQKKLEAEKKTSAKVEKAALAKLEAERARAAAAQQEKEIQGLLAKASSKLQMAEALDARKHDPASVSSADTFVKQAQKAMSEKRYNNAKDLANMAIGKLDAAIAKAKIEYAKKQQKMKLLEERKALFAEATKLGADAKQDQRGVVITLYDMFASGRGRVLPDRTYLLDRIAELAAKYPGYPLVVEGYTDARGRTATNLALSQARAQSVLGYLTQQKKIPFERIKSAGYGSANPIADNSTSAGRAKNRRIEVIFIFR